MVPTERDLWPLVAAAAAPRIITGRRPAGHWMLDPSRHRLTDTEVCHDAHRNPPPVCVLDTDTMRATVFHGPGDIRVE